MLVRAITVKLKTVEFAVATDENQYESIFGKLSATVEKSIFFIYICETAFISIFGLIHILIKMFVIK